MKKFSFHLEPVLKYKGDILEVVKNEHSKALRDVADQEERIKTIENNKKEYIRQFDEKKKKFITVAEVYSKAGRGFEKGVCCSQDSSKSGGRKKGKND